MLATPGWPRPAVRRAGRAGTLGGPFITGLGSWCLFSVVLEELGNRAALPAPADSLGCIARARSSSETLRLSAFAESERSARLGACARHGGGGRRSASLCGLAGAANVSAEPNRASARHRATSRASQHAVSQRVVSMLTSQAHAVDQHSACALDRRGRTDTSQACLLPSQSSRRTLDPDGLGVVGGIAVRLAASAGHGARRDGGRAVRRSAWTVAAALAGLDAGAAAMDRDRGRRATASARRGQLRRAGHAVGFAG